MGFHLESMVGVARWSHSSILKIASQAQVYVMKHYHEVDKHALTRRMASFIGRFLELFLYSILVIPTSNTLSFGTSITTALRSHEIICNEELSLC